MTAAALSIRGLPEWLIRDYLAEMGAEAPPGGDAPRMVALTWSVSWGRQEVQIAGGGFQLTQFDLVFRGDAPAVAKAREAFLKKAQRGGG